MFEVDLSPYQAPVMESQKVERVFDLDVDGDFGDACRRVLTGEVGVVRRGGFPLGVLDFGLALRFARDPLILLGIIRHLAPVGLCAPHVPLGIVLHGLLDDGVIPWLVISEERKSLAAIPPLVLAAHLVELLKGQVEEGGGARLLRHSGKKYLESLSYVDPQDPSGGGPPKCYCCPDAWSGKQPHRLVRSQLNDRDDWGYFLCPNHTQTRVAVSLTCADC